MAAPKGNQLWKLRSSHGRKRIFKTPTQLWNACKKYFEWVEKHPLQAAELVKYQGKARIKRLPKMRAMTIVGLCLHLQIDHKTWDHYCGLEDFIPITDCVKAIIYEQKFTGAAAELLNPNIIARELGLREHTAKEVSGPGGGPIPHKLVDMPPDFKSIDEWVAWHAQQIANKESSDTEQEE